MKDDSKPVPTHKKPKYRIPSIFDQNFDYVNSTRTDVTKTWRKFGWVPTDERKPK
jgi:hypothetical protein